MIDLFAVISTGGIILWAHPVGTLNDYTEVLARFMKDVMIEATIEGSSMICGVYEVHWSIHRELQIIFLVTIRL